MAEKRSCASRLHEIQRDVGLSDKELKAAVKDITRPREVQLPVLRETPTKDEKKQKKEFAPGSKKQKYFYAHWYLEEYLKPEYATKVYMEHPDFNELVEYAYNEALALVQLATFVRNDDLDPADIIPATPDDELDIPEVQWREFDEYCKKHPLKGARDIFTRRQKFSKWRRKRRGRYYSKRRMRMYDPVFAMTAVDEKVMMKNLERIGRENEIRVQKFHEMIESLIPNTAKGSVMLKRFDEQTREIQKRHRQRMKEFMKQRGYHGSPVTFQMDDEPPRVFD